MGIQSASFRGVESSRLRTTYLSGILTAPAEEAVFSVWREGRSHPPTAASDGAGAERPGRQPNKSGAAPGRHLDTYAPGAIVGAFLQEWWAMRSLALPVGVLILIAIWHRAQPDTPVAARASSPPELPSFGGHSVEAS